ncbi:hypothetical protein M8J76_016013 [Diaphorina citri]|nr:hypothetical protein M8J76_016013 [Diaphorina citri]
MRATLAEKEVNTLKEQLSNASVNPVQLSTSDKKMATSPTPNENADINRSAIDLELSAKDREDDNNMNNHHPKHQQQQQHQQRQQQQQQQPPPPPPPPTTTTTVISDHQ